MTRGSSAARRGSTTTRRASAMRRIGLGAVLAVAAFAPSASASDPGTWIKTGQVGKPAYYRQGIASNVKTGDVFFAGSFEGVYRTRGGVDELKANAHVIPKDVMRNEKFNHIGDVAFDASGGGRLLLPLESYAPFEEDTNPSDTGAIGVVDPTTLAWQYYVKLDQSEIAKAQIIAIDPSGLFWTITDDDLLAYNLADLTPGAGPIHSVKRLDNVAPDGAGGAVVLGNRIFLSTQTGEVDRIVSIDLATGASRTEIEMPGKLEAEGLDLGPYLGGLLHWELVPGGGLSSTQLFNFLPTGARLRLKLNHTHIRAGKARKLTATATALTNGYAIPLAGVEIRIAGRVKKTDANGRATLKLKLTRGGYRAQAFYKGLRAATKRIRAS
jgi:hypothetical protein